MDPNEALRNLRNIMVEINDTEGDDLDRFKELAFEAQEQFWALDEWLQKKGFLPDSWAR